MDGNYFFAKVNWSSATSTITLASGHGWAFNGTHVFKGPYEYFRTSNADWTGGNYYCNKCDSYQYDPFGYNSVKYEDEFIANNNSAGSDRVKIIADYKARNQTVTVATYEMDYGRGHVIVFGLSTERVIASSPLFVSFFDYVLFKYAFDLPAENPLLAKERYQLP